MKVNKKQKEKYMEQYKVKLTLGDWSEDGHGHYDIYRYISNYPVNMIQQAYKDSCRKTGLSFNYNEDYTGLGLKYGSPRQIWTEYQSSEISQEACKILKDHGIDATKYFGGTEEQCIANDDAATLIMDFIGLSMPKDWSYKPVKDDFEPINGWWNDKLNVQFGYGLFFD